jgi:hypothetical protein
MYMENVTGFEGQGAFIQKFGLMMEQTATLTVARRRWEQLIGRFGQTIIPGRPCEGDLLYFPLTKGLFEIKFVKHQDPFYQLGRLYVFTLEVELFQYSSEHIDTGVKEIDVFETLKSFSVDGAPRLLTEDNKYLTLEAGDHVVLDFSLDAQDSYGDNKKFQAEADAITFDATNPFGESV